MTTDQGAREARYAEAAWDVLVDHPMWIDDDGQPLEYHPEREQRIGDATGAIARAVLPLVDAEVAAAVSEAQAERDEWRERSKGWRRGYLRQLQHTITRERERDAAEAEVERLRDGIRALADKPSQPGRWVFPEGDDEAPGVWVTDVAALLDRSPAATTGEACACGVVRSTVPEKVWHEWHGDAHAPVSSGEAATGEAGWRSREEQRRLDNLPCPKCGGDRLRADFTDPSRCHVAPVVTPNAEGVSE